MWAELIETLTPLAAAIVLSIPLIWVVRSNKRLTWVTAILLGTWIATIGMLAIAEFPSRFLYWFDNHHDQLGQMLGLSVLEGSDHWRIRDIVVNGVQALLFVVMVALTYFWGERHRKAGRFRS